MMIWCSYGWSLLIYLFLHTFLIVCFSCFVFFYVCFSCFVFFSQLVKWLFQSWYLFLACGYLYVILNCLAYVTRRVVEDFGFPLSFKTFAVHQRGESPWVINQNMLVRLLVIWKETYITASKLLEYFILLVEIVCIPLNSTSLLKQHSR